MRKKLDTRFPAARIKKIMQADEDIGKIAMAVPLLVSKALELFLQDLCDRTYEITLQRGAKTMSSLHLKQCVQSLSVFDFLRHIVSKVPDIGNPDAAGEDRSAKRRKAMEEEENNIDEDTKKSKTEAAGHSSSGRGRGRGWGRGRGRGRGRGTLAADRGQNDKCEDDPDTSLQQNIKPQPVSSDQPDDNVDARESKYPIDAGVRNFDLNVNLDESEDTTVIPSTGSDTVPVSDVKPEEFPGWSISDLGKVPIDPIQFVMSNRRLDEDDDDYDNDDS